MIMKNILLIGLMLITVGNAVAWGEDTPYSPTRAWLADNEYCSPSFTVMVYNTNNTDPNAFNYSLTYTLQYRNGSGSIADETMNTETYNISIGAGQYTWLSHIMNTNTLMNTIDEIEESEDDLSRHVLVELDWDYCDNGGCGSGGTDSVLVDFTNCDPTGGTSYGEGTPDLANVDYGFDNDGKGSSAGSGGMYTGIHLYGSGDDASETGKSFNTIFFLMIPLIFILVVMKMMNRVL